MKPWYTIFVLFFISCPVRANSLARAGCPACHGPRVEDKTCVRCHSPGLRMDRSILYGKAPELKARYTRSGLARFLQDPQDRWFGKGSMFALTAAQMHSVKDFISSNPDDPPPEAALVEAGQKLFIDEGCTSCHTGQGSGPLLQMGYPFLNQQYFTDRVRRGKDRMPAFPQLNAAQIQSLYAYISLSPRPVITEPDLMHLTPASGEKLYRRVMQGLSKAGCVHCHGSGTHSTVELTRLFGAAPQIFFMSANTIDPRSQPALDPKPDCQDSILLQRLIRRTQESKGQRGSERGMPLTGAAFTAEAIRDVRQWSRLGCPDGNRWLCRPCSAGKS